MTDVAFTFGMKDEVTPVLRRQTQEASNLQKTLREAGQAAAKAGGPAGGIAARILGGAGGPFAALALGATVFAGALSVANSLSDRAIADAKERVTWQERLNKAQEAGVRGQSATAAGGLSQAADTRLLLNRGGSIDRARADQKAAGIDLADAIKGESGVQLVSKDRRDSVRENALTLAATGEITFADAVKRLGAVIGRIDPTRELVGIRGQRPTTENLNAAGDTFANSRGEGRGANSLNNIKAAQTAGQQIGLSQSDDLTSGRTAAAVDAAARDALNPGGKAIEDLRAEVASGGRALQAAADAQQRQLAAIASLAKAFGGEGSEADKLTKYNRNTALIRE